MTGDKASQPSRPRATTMDEYNAKLERAKTVRLREIRLAAEAQRGKINPKWKAPGKAKR